VFVPNLSFRNPRLQAEYQRQCRWAPPCRVEPIAELEPVWSGALERQGAAPGLSAYVGASSIYHSPAWGEGMKRGECLSRHQMKDRAYITDAQRVEVRGFLHCGWSLRRIASRVGVSVSVVRRQRALMAEGK
jgi:hypothetical protein